MIKLLQYKKRFLPFTMIGNQSFAIEIILKTRERSPGTTKVLEHPGRHAAKKRDVFQHRELMFVKILLIFLCPAGLWITMVAEQGICPKFAHDERFVEWGGPICTVSVLRPAGIPTDVLIRSKNIDSLTQ